MPVQIVATGYRILADEQRVVGYLDVSPAQLGEIVDAGARQLDLRVVGPGYGYDGPPFVPIVVELPREQVVQLLEDLNRVLVFGLSGERREGLLRATADLQDELARYDRTHPLRVDEGVDEAVSREPRPAGGRALYDLYAHALRAQWRDTPSGLIFSRGPEQPERPPVAWDFLTSAERLAWDSLANRLLEAA